MVHGRDLINPLRHLSDTTMVPGRAPERWERWECVPSQFVILAATFGQPAEIALK